MNERIKECWLTAARQDCDDKWDTQEEFIERFAKLIVRECITAVQNTPKHCAYTTFQESIVDCTVDMSVKSIEQHFSIKGTK